MGFTCPPPASFTVRRTAAPHYQQQWQGLEDFWPRYLICAVSSREIYVLSGRPSCRASWVGEENPRERDCAGVFLARLCARSPAVHVLWDSLQEPYGVRRNRGEVTEVWAPSAAPQTPLLGSARGKVQLARLSSFIIGMVKAD